MHPQKPPHDVADVATLLGYAAAQRADPRFVSGQLDPSSDAATDRLIDHSVWEAALTLWTGAVEAGGSPPQQAQQKSQQLLRQAMMLWDTSDRPAADRGPDGRAPHPVQQLALERFAIIGQRAANGQPLCPDLDGETSPGEPSPSTPG
ncbi:hypothetical protein ACQEVF_57775 [Nonomuraea polychroma]|uniref:hypothetical protein n=1 Tax=Nonomuraea polychroma TaxID=46176 RepID=UPI003D8F6DB1